MIIFGLLFGLFLRLSNNQYLNLVVQRVDIYIYRELNYEKSKSKFGR